MKKKRTVPTIPRQHRLGFLIYDVARAMRNLADETMKPYGLTQSQWSLLVYVVESGDVGLMQTELARLLNLRKVSVGGLVDRLEKSGFITRQNDETDRRVNRVYITEKGRAILQEANKIGLLQGDQIAAGISNEDLKTTKRVLLEIHDKILELIERT